MIYGLDGASWQGYPDWGTLYAEGHRFMIWKVTGEGNYVNPTAQANLLRAYNAGFITGGYDWFEPQNASALPTGEAAANDYARVLDALGAWRKGFIPTVDWETPDWYKGPLGRNVEEYCRRYFGRLYDIATIEKGCQNIGIYSAPYFMEETGGYQWTWLKRYLYWIAAPGGGMLPDDAPWPSGALVKPWDAATWHQHQWYAQSPAVVGNFDRDRFNGDTARLWAIGYQGGGRPQPEESNVQEPPADKWTVYINPQGETIVVLNFGGNTKRVDGVRIVDVGVSVESATEPGKILDRSFQGEAAQPWRERGPGATRHTVTSLATTEERPA